MRIFTQIIIGFCCFCYAQSTSYQFTGTAGTGDGTFYTSNGADGNCGFPKSPSQLFAAFPGPIWTNSFYCGSCINVVGPKGSVDVKVYDQCPECLAGSLDLSPTAFNLIADPSQGRVAISWSFTSCTGLDAEPLSLTWASTSTPSSYSLRVIGQKGPINSVNLGYTNLIRQSDNSWNGNGDAGTLLIQYADGTSVSLPNVSILQQNLDGQTYSSSNITTQSTPSNLTVSNSGQISTSTVSLKSDLVSSTYSSMPTVSMVNKSLEMNSIKKLSNNLIYSSSNGFIQMNLLILIIVILLQC